MENTGINDIRYNELEFLKLYLEYFNNVIDPQVKQDFKIEKTDEKLYQFCENCINRIMLLIDYAMKKGIDVKRPSDACFDIAMAYQNLLEHKKMEEFDQNFIADISEDAYLKNKRILSKYIRLEDDLIFQELFQFMEEQEKTEDCLFQNIQMMRHLWRIRKLQDFENQLFFTTPEDSHQELCEMITGYVKKRNGQSSSNR